MTTGRDHLSKSETITIAAIEENIPTLVEARALAIDFQSMIRAKPETQLSPWLALANSSILASFVRGITSDEAAVRAAITSQWSNERTEAQTTRLKQIKRQMYGRAKLDLPQARLIGAV